MIVANFFNLKKVNHNQLNLFLFCSRMAEIEDKRTKEVLSRVQKQKEERDINEDDGTIYVDASRNIAVSIGSKDLR